jgi:hypothetical protein
MRYMLVNGLSRVDADMIICSMLKCLYEMSKNQLSKTYKQLNELVAKNKVPIITAVQVSNPNARIYEAGDFGIPMVIIDYVKLI